jgi:hypothetical protein
MNDEQESNMGKQAWQSQALDAPPISLELIQFHVRKLNSSWRCEIGAAYGGVVAGVCAVVFGFLWHAPTVEMKYVQRIGMVLVMLAGIYIAIRVRRLGAQVAQQESVTRSLDAYRLELARRRDYYLSGWRWSFWPLMPGVSVLMIGKAVFDPRPRNLALNFLVFAFALIAYALSILHQRRKARTLQQELDALATLGQQKS